MSAAWRSAARLSCAEGRSGRSPCWTRVVLTRHRTAVRTFGSGAALAARRVKPHPVLCAAAVDGAPERAMAEHAATSGTALLSPSRMTSALVPGHLNRSWRLRRAAVRHGGRSGARRERRPLAQSRDGRPSDRLRRGGAKALGRRSQRAPASSTNVAPGIEPSSTGTPAVTPMPASRKPRSRITARWPALFIHAVTIDCGVESVPSPQAMSSPRDQSCVCARYPARRTRSVTAPEKGETWAKKRWATMSAPCASAATRSWRLGRRARSAWAARSALTRHRTADSTVAAGAWPAATVVAAQGGDAAYEAVGVPSTAIARRRGVATAARSRRGRTVCGIGFPIGAAKPVLYSPRVQVDGRPRHCDERLRASAGWGPFDTLSNGGRQVRGRRTRVYPHRRWPRPPPTTRSPPSY